jgi:uncharacterized membrane protein
MNRATFMNELRAGLSGLHSQDVNEILADYDSHFADGAAHGRSEDEVAQALGDPARLARELRAEAGFKRWENDRSAGNLLGVIFALIGLATLDLVFLLPLLLVVGVMIFAFGIAFLAFIVAGTFLVLNLLGHAHHFDNALVQLLVGVGLLSGGIGGGAILLLFTNWFFNVVIRYARLHFRLFDSATAPQGA